MKVAVVGAGVVGLACALELRREGAEVVVVDRGEVGGGTSRGNAGWVVPSLTSPLPAPGMVKEGLRQLVTGGDAFVLRPSLDPAYARWLWSFWRSCSEERFAAGVRALLALNARTLELFDRYRDEGIEFEMHATGLVVAALTDSGLEHYRRIFESLHGLGYEGGDVNELDGGALHELEPAVDPGGVAGGLHAVVDRHVRPETLTAGLAARLSADGVEIRERAELTELHGRGGRWQVVAGKVSIEADRVVVAAGVATAPLLHRLGARIPLQGARGYSVVVEGTGTPPRHALYLAEAKLGLSPFTAGVRIAGVFELGARDTSVPAGMGRRLAAAASPYLSGWRPDGEIPEAWAGLRPATPDGLPLIGPVPGLDGLFLATGHGMVGVTLAPATGALLAPLVVRGEAAPELEPFSLARF
jgi:D-amino-acid dehydrogenase